MANKKINILLGLKGGKKTEGGLKKVDKRLNMLGKTAVGLAAGFATMQTAMKAWDTAKMAAKAEVVESKFRRLIDQPDKFLTNMKKASAGTISELELMQKANAAALLGLPLDRFDDMMKIARNAAQATGESMDFMLNSIVTGIGRQSKLMIDNLGIIVSAGEANEKYAAQLGKSASALTDLERKQAFANEVIEKGLANVEKAGGVSATSADAYDRLGASAKNLAEAVGEKLNPVISTMAAGLASAADSVTDMISGDDGMNAQLVKMLDFNDKFALSIENTSIPAMVRMRKVLVEMLPDGQIISSAFQDIIDLINILDQQIGKAAENAEIRRDEIEGITKLVGVDVPAGVMKFSKSLDFLDKRQRAIITLTDNFASSLGNAVIYGQELGPAVVSSLQAIASQLISQAATYALLNMFTGGTFGAMSGGGLGGFLKFAFGSTG
ncbi:MAG: hypothetical protein ACE5D7_00805, partial [Fidelibacterota bacterium]